MSAFAWYFELPQSDLDRSVDYFARSRASRKMKAPRDSKQMRATWKVAVATSTRSRATHVVLRRKVRRHLRARRGSRRRAPRERSLSHIAVRREDPRDG